MMQRRDYLMHRSHKYVSKVFKNGKWRYNYSTSSKESESEPSYEEKNGYALDADSSEDHKKYTKYVDGNSLLGSTTTTTHENTETGQKKTYTTKTRGKIDRAYEQLKSQATSSISSKVESGKNLLKNIFG